MTSTMARNAITALFVVIVVHRFRAVASFPRGQVGLLPKRHKCRGSRTLLFAKSSSELAPSYYQCLLQRFQGDFDNYNQVVQDRRRGLLPAEGGGHEHIHCTLVPCPNLRDEQNSVDQEQWVIAAFYLNGNPKQIFRFRMYRMIPSDHENDECDSSNNNVRLKLHTLSPELDQVLRSNCSEQPWTWWNEVYNMWSETNLNQNNSRNSYEGWDEFQTEGVLQMVSLLNGCDVLWNPDWDASNHSYLYQDEYDESAVPLDTVQSEKACHATMEAGPGGVIVDSISMIPGKRILIKDELSLWENEFWINDRGYDPDASKDGEDIPYVYGNRRGVPYKLERVACMKSACNTDKNTGNLLTLQREVVNPLLEWTLGDAYRTSGLYQQKIAELEAI